MSDTKEILKKVDRLIIAHKQGLLGGEKMPEDENPGLDKSSKENLMYFTLPMSLNYQRNSYVLWECANKMYKDVPEIFDSKAVCEMSDDDLRDILVKYRVALQPNKQYSVKKMKEYIASHKKNFPYLGGNKICNYWLYVLEQYTDIKFTDRENITVAPDTHVVQASIKLGVISESESLQSNVQEIVVSRWEELLKSTDLKPIDVHTPMWLWSRGKFSVEI